VLKYQQSPKVSLCVEKSVCVYRWQGPPAHILISLQVSLSSAAKSTQLKTSNAFPQLQTLESSGADQG